MEIRIRASGAVMFENEFRRWVQETDGATFDAVTPDILEQFGADPVFEGPQPTTTKYQTAARDGVFEQDGKWFTKYTAVDLDAAAVDARQASNVRADRNRRLAECDWTQLADAPVDQAAWASYRQALRDIPAQVGFPWNHTWPALPT